MSDEATTEGLLFRVSNTALRAHCAERAGYHARRADEKEAEIPKLRESLEVVGKQGVNVAPKYANSVSRIDVDSAIEHVEHEIRAHRARAARFEWFASHLFAGDYSLSVSELNELELLP